MGHHPASKHIDHGQSNLGGITYPDLVAAVDHQLARQLGNDFVLELSLTFAWLWCACLDAHLDHQCAHMKATDLVALPPKCSAQLARTHEWEIQMDQIHHMHDAENRRVRGVGSQKNRAQTDVDAPY